MVGDVSMDTSTTDTSTKVLYVRVDGELHRNLKISAVALGVSLQSLCETILRIHVDQQRENSTRGMFRIRVISGHKNIAKDFGVGKTIACTVIQVCFRS